MSVKHNSSHVLVITPDPPIEHTTRVTPDELAHELRQAIHNPTNGALARLAERQHVFIPAQIPALIEAQTQVITHLATEHTPPSDTTKLIADIANDTSVLARRLGQALTALTGTTYP